MSLHTEFSNIEEYLEDYEKYYHEETVLDVWNNCVVLSVLSILPTILNLVCTNFLLGSIIYTGYFSVTLLHVLCGSGGIYLITTLESETGKLIFCVCWITSFLFLQFEVQCKKFFHSAIFLQIILIVSLILCEYCLVESEIWLQIRGVVMILAMKIISLSYDMEQGNVKPSFVQYFGYTLCSGNVLFGPWISFSDYLNLFRKQKKKNLIWICSIVKVLTTAIIFVTLSNCWSSYIIKDDQNRWLVTYREAFSFRTSHYFVSYLAETGMIALGFTNPNKKSVLNKYRFIITEPLEIEFPSSLSVVVKKWNQPMHEFLKKYVFISSLKYGKFLAIFATFMMSSFLHGFELKVSMVLLTIGVFSYLQVAPRDRISDIFDCCVKVRPCRDCKHKYKRDNIRVKIMLILYCLMTVFHLAYLGILMDPTTDKLGIYEKWHNLYFISHIIMFFNVMIIL